MSLFLHVSIAVGKKGFRACNADGILITTMSAQWQDDKPRWKLTRKASLSPSLVTSSWVVFGLSKGSCGWGPGSSPWEPESFLLSKFSLLVFDSNPALLRWTWLWRFSICVQIGKKWILITLECTRKLQPRTGLQKPLNSTVYDYSMRQVLIENGARGIWLTGPEGKLSFWAIFMRFVRQPPVTTDIPGTLSNVLKN